MNSTSYLKVSVQPFRTVHRRLRPSGVGLLALAILGLSAWSLQAAGAVWNVDSAGTWSTGADWDSGTAPGSTSGTGNTDTATFGPAISAARIITVDSGRNIFDIDFSGNTFGYTLSSGSLLLSSGGSIQSSGTGASVTDTISAPITLEGNGGSYTFNSGSSVASNILSISGSVTGASSSGNVTTLNLNGASAGSNLLSGVLGDGSAGGQLGLALNSGDWTISGSNTFTGPVTVNAGTLSITSTGGVDAANVITVASGATLSTSMNISVAGLDGAGTVINSTTNSRTVTLRGAGNYSFSGQLDNGSGTANLTQSGTGTQTLSGSNAFSGAVTLSAGTLDLNFAASGAPASNILSSGVAPAALSMSGGTLVLTGSTGTANSQTLSKITPGVGASTIDLVASGSNPLLFSFGGFGTRSAGGTVNFILPANAQSATNGILTTAANSNGIIGGYATVGGTDWAVSGAAAPVVNSYTAAINGGDYIFSGNLANGTAISLSTSLSTGTPSTAVSSGQLVYVVGYNSSNSTYEISTTPGGSPITNTSTTTAGSGSPSVSTQGNLTALASYASFTGSGDSSTGNYLLTGSGTLAGSETINSLKLTTTASSQALSLGSGTLTLTSGGLLFVGSNNYQITGGTLKGSNSDLVVQQYGTGSLTIGSAIGGTGALTLSGTGTLIITSANSYSGGTFLNGGILDFNGINALGSGGVTFNGGTLQYAAGSTVDISGRTITFNATGGTIDTNGNNVTFANAIGNSGIGGFTKAGQGTLTLDGVNSYTGNTTITAGTLLLSGSGSISGSPVIDVKSGATLDVSLTSAQEVLGTSQSLIGNGRINGPVTVSGALTPGESGSVGVLTFNNSLTLNSTSHTLLTLSSPASYSQIVVGNSQSSILTEGGSTLTLSLTLGSLSDTSYTLFSLLNGSTVSGDFGAVYLDSNAFTFNNGSDTWTYLDSLNGQSYSFADNTGILTLAAVPEPSSWMLLLASLGALVGVKGLKAIGNGRFSRNRQVV